MGDHRAPPSRRPRSTPLVPRRRAWSRAAGQSPPDPASRIRPSAPEARPSTNALYDCPTTQFEEHGRLLGQEGPSVLTRAPALPVGDGGASRTGARAVNHRSGWLWRRSVGALSALEVELRRPIATIW